MIEIIAYVLASITFFGLLYAYISLLLTYRKVSIQLLQAQIDRDLFKLKLTEEISKKENKKIEQTDGFIKFISQSRDWAFDYIEDVQQAILELREYFDKNGLNLNTEEAKAMMEKIEKVVEFLPKDSKND